MVSAKRTGLGGVLAGKVLSIENRRPYKVRTRKQEYLEIFLHPQFEAFHLRVDKNHSYGCRKEIRGYNTEVQ